MNTGNITTYLTDHLAGSVAALELLDHLVALREGKGDVEEIQSLKAEVEADQQLLQHLLGRFGVNESTVKKAGAWVAEKALMVKVKAGNGDLGLLEALEVLVLGIEGKLRLWRALECVDIGLNLPELQTAAANQIQRVETLRRQAACRAFLSSES